MKKLLLLSATLALSAAMAQTAIAAPETEPSGATPRPGANIERVEEKYLDVTPGLEVPMDPTETEPEGVTPKPGVNIEARDTHVAPEPEVPADPTETEPAGVTPKPGVNIEERTTETEPASEETEIMERGPETTTTTGPRYEY